MSHLVIYQYPQCGTCRNAMKWLRSHGHELEIRHIVEEPPTVAELNDLIDKSELELKKFFNVSGEVYKNLGLKDKLGDMSREEQIELLASNGKLIKRPIVSDGKQVTVGFKEDNYANVWGSQ